MKNQFNRRSFIQNTAVATLGAVAIPQIVDAAFKNNATHKASLQAGDVVLFQGDSITDWYRDKNETNPNSFKMMGTGYAAMAAADLLMKHPTLTLQVFNKGISGNKVYQLADRWDTDCLKLKPNVLSILIGVNDFWHAYNGKYNGTLETYKTDYKKLLDRTKQALPNVKLIIGEPFGLQNVKAVTAQWYPAFDGYRRAAQDIAREYDAIFIPYQSVFNEALKLAPGSYWTSDGVHPSMAGASLMAHAWLKAVK